ncbi:hypothetical protein IK110_00615 [Candidatus Saccharibacteria bacterium]|nr:hypothetical protein [Candidatus Saccharibacteria bacterium]
MKVYFSGISGVGIGPLAELAQDAGMTVCGSDMSRGTISDELAARNIPIAYGPQDGSFLREQLDGLDWFVHTSALPKDHIEIQIAREAGVRVSKRDEFIVEFIKQHNQKLIAVAGTHGKTTTTSMLIWCCRELGVKANYLDGTTLPWGESAEYKYDDAYLIYEADEFDRNFLAYHPYLAVITSVDYDHADIYPTPEDYRAAFAQFESQSQDVVKNTTIDNRITLAGELRRLDASICLAAMKKLCDNSEEEIIDVLNRFPGAGRRFEEVVENVYSDYAHHPEEIVATIKMAKEVVERDGLKGIVAVYQPLQNMRQYEVRHQYGDTFQGVDKLFWVPTFLLREDPSLAIITPAELITEMNNPEIAEAADMDDVLGEKLRTLQKEGWLIILLAGGGADKWFRKVFNH